MCALWAVLSSSWPPRAPQQSVAGPLLLTHLATPGCGLGQKYDADVCRLCQSLWWLVHVFCVLLILMGPLLVLWPFWSFWEWHREAWTSGWRPYCAQVFSLPKCATPAAYPSPSTLRQLQHSERKSPLAVPHGKCCINHPHVQPTPKPPRVFLTLHSFLMLRPSG